MNYATELRRTDFSKRCRVYDAECENKIENFNRMQKQTIQRAAELSTVGRLDRGLDRDGARGYISRKGATSVYKTEPFFMLF